MKKVAVLVLNEYVNDSRVIKQVESLSSKYPVDVFALNNGAFKKLEQGLSDVRIFRKVSYAKPSNLLIKKVKQVFVYFQYLITSFLSLNNYDIVHCNDLETLPIGTLGKLFNRNLKVVYDAHEYETETLWMQNKFKKYLAKKLEGFLIHYADGVCVVSDGIANEYVRLYNIDKPYLVLNTPKLVTISKQDIFREKFSISKDTKIFLYQGGLTKGRGIEILLESFCRLGDSKQVIIFMGYGPLENEVKKFAANNDNIYFHEAVSPDVLLSYTSSADFGILFYEDNCLNHKYCSPNKMFEYLVAGIPVISSNLVEMKRLVEVHQLGLVSASNDSQGFLDCVKLSDSVDYPQLVENVISARTIFNWEQQEKITFTMYESL